MDAHDQIRILDLLPGDYGSDICCTMRTTSIDNSEPYEALSYVWGRDMSSRSITISGRDVTVTQNLYDGLQRLRSPTGTRTLWIDQLCINQENSEEKTHQVNMMRRIYKQCTQCVIWLGEIPQGKGITLLAAQGAIDYIRFWAEIPERRNLRSRTPHSLSTREKCEAASKAFEALFLPGNPWWSRIWTVQEAVLPATAELRWGPLQVPWEMVGKAALILLRPRMWGCSHLRPKSSNLNDTFFAPVRGLQIATKGENVLDLLQRWRYRQATDQRDKIYGLMGLYPDTLLPSVQSCDYNVTPRALYTKVTTDLIMLEKGLRPLVGARERSDLDLPTWVVDFSTRPGVSTTDWWWDHSHRYKRFNADEGRQFEWKTLQDGALLSLTGVCVDRVERVGDVLALPRNHDAPLDRVLSIVQSWSEVLAQYVDSDPTGRGHPYGESLDSLETAFYKTLIGDLITEEFPIRRAVGPDKKQILDCCMGLTVNDTTTSLCSMVVNKAFFITNSGFLGIGPPNVEAGDEAWILFGGKVPFILKPIGGSISDGNDGARKCTTVGSAFVHGVMDGEALKLGKPPRNVHIY